MKKSFKIFLKTLILFILIFIIGFLIYAKNYYKADNIANEILNENNFEIKDNLITLKPEMPSEIGIIFYPGAKVEYTAYIPLLNQLKDKGYNCFLVKMPFNFAFFKVNVADKIIKDNPYIKNWYISGHSLGGAMASSYISKNLDKIDGLILLGAYVYGNVPLEKYITIYGSEDLILNKNKLKNTENEILINGGNHAQFGNYGKQKGDGNASITTTEQQNLTINLINEFILNIQKNSL